MGLDLVLAILFKQNFIQSKEVYNALNARSSANLNLTDGELRFRVYKYHHVCKFIGKSVTRMER